MIPNLLKFDFRSLKIKSSKMNSELDGTIYAYKN